MTIQTNIEESFGLYEKVLAIMKQCLLRRNGSMFRVSSLNIRADICVLCEGSDEETM